MSSLIDSLLNGTDDVRPERPAPRDRQLAEAVRRKVVNARGFLTLSEAECRALCQLLEARPADPFVSPKFSLDDLKKLGLEQPEELTNPLTDDEDDEDDPELAAKRPERLIPTHLALVAPNLTPGHDSPIPLSFLAAKSKGAPKGAPKGEPEPALEDEEGEEEPEGYRPQRDGYGRVIDAAPEVDVPDVDQQLEARAMAMIWGAGGPSLTEDQPTAPKDLAETSLAVASAKALRAQRPVKTKRDLTPRVPSASAAALAQRAAAL